MQSPSSTPISRKWMVGALLAATVFGYVVASSRFGTNVGDEKTRVSVLDEMLRTKRLKIGYAVYPPYSTRDPNTGELSGYSIELIRAILEPLEVEPVWVETTWDNMKQDVILGKFDLMVEPIFYTIPRASKVAFTNPYAYFGYGVVIVKQGEKRFKTIQDLNDPGITIAVTQGVTDQEFAEKYLPKAKLNLIPGADQSITLNEVLVGKADAALSDVPPALAFVKAHGPAVEALFIDDPPATTPAGFMTRQSEVELLNFLNTSLLFLETNGMLDALEAKYELPSFREKRQWIKGRGLNGN